MFLQNSIQWTSARSQAIQTTSARHLATLDKLSWNSLSTLENVKILTLFPCSFRPAHAHNTAQLPKRENVPWSWVKGSVNHDSSLLFPVIPLSHWLAYMYTCACSRGQLWRLAIEFQASLRTNNQSSKSQKRQPVLLWDFKEELCFTRVRDRPEIHLCLSQKNHNLLTWRFCVTAWVTSRTSFLQHEGGLMSIVVDATHKQKDCVPAGPGK